MNTLVTGLMLLTKRNYVKWVNKVNSADLSPKNIFRAFRACSFKDCKVVFLGLKEE